MSRMPTASGTALVVVDMQEDFVRGSLAVGDAEALVPMIRETVKRHPWDLVVFTADAHPPSHESFVDNITDARLHPKSRKKASELCAFDEALLTSGKTQVMWPSHCVEGTPGAELVIAPREDDVVVLKGQERESYSAFCDVAGTNTPLLRILRDRGITHIVLCGVAYDWCVSQTALDGVARGLRVSILRDLTRAVDPDEGASDATAKLEAAGVNVLQSSEFRFPTSTSS